MKLEFSRQIFEKYSNIKFHENPFIGSRVVPCGRTDITKLIVAFRNFTNAPKKRSEKKTHRSHLQQCSYVPEDGTDTLSPNVSNKMPNLPRITFHAEKGLNYTAEGGGGEEEGEKKGWKRTRRRRKHPMSKKCAESLCICHMLRPQRVNCFHSRWLH